MAKKLYRVSVGVTSEINDVNVVNEYVLADDEVQATHYAEIFVDRRGYTVGGVENVVEGHFVEGYPNEPPPARLPTPRAEARWEQVDENCWRFEFAHRAYAYLAYRPDDKDAPYLAWIELNGIPCIDDTELHGPHTLEQAQRGACAFAANELTTMMFLLHKQVTG